MQASEVGEYLEHVADLLLALGGVPVVGPVVDVDFLDDTGRLDLTIQYATREQFDVALVATGPNRFPEWTFWSFHLRDAGDACIFRYDGSHHLPGTAHFPSHKHVGPDETASDCPVPAIADILRELREHLYPDAS